MNQAAPETIRPPSFSGTARAEGIETVLRQTHRAFRRSRLFKLQVRRLALRDLDEILAMYEEEDTSRLLESIGRYVADLEHNVGEGAVEALGPQHASRVGAAVLAIETYLGQIRESDDPDISAVFCTVCLWCVADALESARN